MRKSLILSIAALSLVGVAAFGAAKPVQVWAEGSEPATSQAVEQSAEGSAEQSAVASVEPAVPEYAYAIKEPAIQYRDSEAASYSVGDAKIGSAFLSAEGWNEGAEPIQMTIKGNVTTKLESKIVYIYEYKPTTVVWNGKEIKANAEKVYLLEKPAEPGAYDLTVYFTKTVITNPLDLTSVNWASFLTVQNLMTIGSWVVIVAGALILYFLNRKYKRENATTLDKVEDALAKKVEDVWGKSAAEEMSKVFEKVVGASFAAIDSKLSKVDNNNATLIRCLLLMQEDTPQARLAIIECLSKIDVSADAKSEEISALIKSEMDKYKAEQEAREKALLEAKQANEAWKETAKVEPEAKPEPEPAKGNGDDGGYGTL